MMPKLTQNLESCNPTILSLDNDQAQKPTEDKSSQTLIVEPLSSGSENSTILLDNQGCDDLNLNPTSKSGPSGKSKKKKKKGKKKKKNLGAKDEALDKSDVEKENSDSDIQLGSSGMPPFTSSGSAMQNKIKLVYDEFVKCHNSNQLRLMQVVDFAKCLSEARSELQSRGDTLKRKHVIIKALLYNADRSSLDISAFNKIGDQISKFDLEQKRLKDDGTAYNFAQEKFVQSPAYKKFLEIKACIEEKEKELEETRFDDFATISFEDLLAEEKNDIFWQKKGNSGQCSSSGSK